MAKKPAKKTVKKTIRKPAKKGVKKTVKKKTPPVKADVRQPEIAVKEETAAVSELKLFSVIKKSFDIAVKNFWELMFILFFPAACLLLGYLPSYRPGADAADLGSYNWPLIIAGYLTGIIMYIMVFVVMDRREKGLREKSAGEYARENLIGAIKRFPSVFLLGVIYLLVFSAVFVPMVFIGVNAGENMNVLSAAGIVLFFILFFVLMAVIVLVYGQAFMIAITRPGIKNPLSHSAKITKGKRWNILVLLCLMALIVMSVELMAMIPVFIMGVLSMTFLPLLALVGIIYMVFMMAVNIFYNAFYYSLFKSLEDSYVQNGRNTPA